MSTPKNFDIQSLKFPTFFLISLNQSSWRFLFNCSIDLYEIRLQAGGYLSSISFAIERVPPLNDSHCMHTISLKLMPLFHTALVTFLFELYGCLLFKF